MNAVPSSLSGESITIFTIGFTGKSAQDFFGKLQQAGVKRLIDVRLNNVSQLAGFTKKNDLRYFLKAIADIDYVHLDDLAPTKDILDRYKNKKEIDWADYEDRFKALLDQRQPEGRYTRTQFDMSCLLCSEATPEHCHRRLVVERLRSCWANVNVVHL